MADVTVVGVSHGTHYLFSFQGGPVFTDGSTGYYFYVTSDVSFAYVKTTDGGQSWGSPVTIKSSTTIVGYAVWFDKWTPGGTGTQIHCAYVDVPDATSNDLYYRALDTSDDSLGSEVTVAALAPSAGAGIYTSIFSTTVDSGNCSITRAQGGNIYISNKAHIENGASDLEIENFYRSTDGGTSFASRTSPFEVIGGDGLLLLPGDTIDTQDIAGIYLDVSANALSIKMYDDSANTWTETAIAAMTEVTTAHNYSAAIRNSDQHILLAWANAGDAATTDINFRDITANSIAAPTVTVRTDVISDTAETQEPHVWIDNTTGDVYVVYMTGTTWTSAVQVWYKKSTDSGATWGAAVQVSESAESDIRQAMAGHSSPVGSTEARMYPVWHKNDTDTLLGNYNNSVAIGITSTLVKDVIGGMGIIPFAR